MKKLIIKSILTVSFAEQVVELENESMHVTLRLKDQKLFLPTEAKGEKVDIFAPGQKKEKKQKEVTPPVPPVPPVDPKNEESPKE